MSQISAETGSAPNPSLWERSIGQTTFEEVEQKLEKIQIPNYAKQIVAGTLALFSYLAPTFMRGFEAQNQKIWIYKFPHSFVSDASNMGLSLLMTEGIIIGTALTGAINESNSAIVGPPLMLTSLMGTKIISNMITHRHLNIIGKKSLTKNSA